MAETIQKYCPVCGRNIVKDDPWQVKTCTCGWSWNYPKRNFKVATICILTLLFLFSWKSQVCSRDRCEDYASDVRLQYTRYFGSGFPHWYALGQLKQESGCRANLTAFDGGQGLAQFMPVTEMEVERGLGEKLDMYNPEHAIRANAYYMSRLHKQNKDGRLCFTYMFYNSGPGTVMKEANKAGKWDYNSMTEVCNRKILKLKNGKTLDLCEVGYDYPVKIYGYGEKFKKGSTQWRYW